MSASAHDATLRIAPGQIEEILQPFISRRFAESDQEWLGIQAHAAKRWRKEYYRRKVRRLLLGSSKRVDRVDFDYSLAWGTQTKPWALGVTMFRWGGQGLEMNSRGEKRLHVMLISNLLSQLQPKTVLEVGSGDGAVSMSLAVMHPEIKFSGIELTSAGVAAARKLQAEDQLTADLVELLPYPHLDSRAHQRVDFKVGNAAQLPFERNDFDLVFTSLALEQMSSVANSALSEISRVAKDAAIFLEPFPEYNTSAAQRYYCKANEYLPVRVDSLHKRGLNPVASFADFPSKLNRGVGLVLATPTAE